MTYPIHPESPFWVAVIGKNRQTLFLAEQLRSVQTSTVCSPIAAAAAAAAAGHHEGSSLIHGLLGYFFLDQGFPVEYGLDTFNTPHTGTTLRHPQNLLCRLRCLIPLRHLATTSPMGNIFWRYSHFSTNNQNHKLTMTSTSISSNSKHDFRYIRRTYFPRTSNDTRCYSQLYHNFHSSTYFFPFPTRLVAQTQTL